MLILSLDTTTKGGSTAVVRDDDVLVVRPGDASRTHGERLPGEMAAVLAEAGAVPSAVDLLVVASGPGAFTGLRIGLASMQGLALALDKPVVGVSALDALAGSLLLPLPGTASPAADPRPIPIATWMDAQRGEVYAALHEPTTGDTPLPSRLRLGPTVGAPDTIIARWQHEYDGPLRFVGDGALHFRAIIERTRPDWVVEQVVPLLAPALAYIGRRRAANGEAGPAHALQPLYVRRPDAELERERSGQP